METPSRNLRRNRRPTQRKIEADMQNTPASSRRRDHPVEDSESGAKQESHASRANDAQVLESISSLAGPFNHRSHQRERRDVNFTIFEGPMDEGEDYENMSHQLANYHYEDPLDEDEGYQDTSRDEQDAALASVATEDQIRQVRSVLAGLLDDRSLDRELRLTALAIYGERLWSHRYGSHEAPEPEPEPQPLATGEGSHLHVMGHGNANNTAVSPAPDFFEVSPPTQDLPTTTPTSDFFDDAFFFNDPSVPTSIPTPPPPPPPPFDYADLMESPPFEPITLPSEDT